MIKKLNNELLGILKDTFNSSEMKIIEKNFEIEKRNPSFRVNILKWNKEDILSELKDNNLIVREISFLEDFFILENGIERDLWNLDLYKYGKIYLQSLSSVLPVNLFSNFKKENIKILDTTAAPWWKTSQLSAKFPNAEIYAFEKNKIRFEKMIYNLKKLWCSNVKAINDDVMNTSNYVNDLDFFDYILFDAPCTGEGNINLNKEKTYSSWDIKYVNKNYKLQKNILKTVIPYLKSSWEIIYSTCTLNPIENENIVHFILCNFSELEIKSLDLDYKYLKKPLKSFRWSFYRKDVENAIRIIPNEETEGFFIAKFRKN